MRVTQGALKTREVWWKVAEFRWGAVGHAFAVKPGMSLVTEIKRLIDDAELCGDPAQEWSPIPWFNAARRDEAAAENDEVPPEFEMYDFGEAPKKAA